MKDFLNDENTPQEETKTQKTSEGVKYEENDNWEFEAEAPTLKNSIENDEFEIEMPAPKPKPVKKAASAPAAKKSKKSGNTGKFILTAVISVIIIVVLVVLGVRYYTVPNSNEKMNPGNVALTVGDTDVSIGMYNYYYTAITQNYIYYANYGYYDLDTSVDYSEQTTTDSDGKTTTWAKIFVNDTVNQLQYITAYYEAAVKAGVTLTDEQEETIETQLSSLKETAADSDLSVDEYIAETYGDYCGYATLKKMLVQAYTAENYYQQKNIEDKATDEEIQAYYEEHADDYSEVSFAYLQIPYESDSKDETLKEAKGYAKKISSVADVKKLIPTACADLLQEYVDAGYFTDVDEAAETLAENVETSLTKSDTSFTDEGMEWLFSDDTKIGDCSTFVDETNSLIYVVLKTSEPTVQDEEVYSVRHILITPESEDSDDDSDDSDDESTTTTYTDEEWAAAKEEADKILDEYNSGDKTEYSFALLAEKYSDDTESTSNGSSGLYGGLYADTSLGQMVSSFENWATDSSRQYGDVDIVKSDYGYHIMYFVEDTMDYLYDCEAAVLSEKENDFVDSMTVKKHKKAMAKTTVAKPTSTSDDDDNDTDD